MIYGWDYRPMNVAIVLLGLGLALSILSFVCALLSTIISSNLYIWLALASGALGGGALGSLIVGIIGFCVSYMDKT